MDIYEKIEAILACPICLGDLDIGHDNMFCSHCNVVYTKKHGKYYFKEFDSIVPSDLLSHIKTIIKKYEALYAFCMTVIAPTLKVKRLKNFVQEDEDVVVELGSGNTNLNDNWIKIDCVDYPNVHIVCDIEHLPLKNDVVDVHYNCSVLEHVPNPSQVVGHIHRTLKKGGIVISSVPFLVPYHASPYDYHRFTSSGVLNLFQDFTAKEFGMRSGPFSALLWILQETLASLLSFGNMRIRSVLLMLLYLLLFPLKFLDLIFLLYPFKSLEGIASNFYFVGEKV